MANLPSSRSKVNDVEVAQDAPVSESLMDKLGSNDNESQDKNDEQDGRLDALEADTAVLNSRVDGLNTILQRVYGPVQSSVTVDFFPTDTIVGIDAFYDVDTQRSYLRWTAHNTANVMNKSNIDITSSVGGTGRRWDFITTRYERSASGTGFNIQWAAWAMVTVADV